MCARRWQGELKHKVCSTATSNVHASGYVHPSARHQLVVWQGPHSCAGEQEAMRMTQSACGGRPASNSHSGLPPSCAAAGVAQAPPPTRAAACCTAGHTGRFAIWMTIA